MVFGNLLLAINKIVDKYATIIYAIEVNLRAI